MAGYSLGGRTNGSLGRTVLGDWLQHKRLVNDGTSLLEALLQPEMRRVQKAGVIRFLPERP